MFQLKPLCWFPFMLSVDHAECHNYTHYTDCEQAWASFKQNVSIKYIMLSIIYAECHLCWVSQIKSFTFSWVPSVIIAERCLCWMSQLSPLGWMSLWWVLFGWVSRRHFGRVPSYLLKATTKSPLEQRPRNGFLELKLVCPSGTSLSSLCPTLT